MAVPKKRTSKAKKNIRKTVWKKKALKHAVHAYYLAKLKIRNDNTNEKENISS